MVHFALILSALWTDRYLIWTLLCDYEFYSQNALLLWISQRKICTLDLQWMDLQLIFHILQEFWQYDRPKLVQKWFLQELLPQLELSDKIVKSNIFDAKEWLFTIIRSIWSDSVLLPDCNEILEVRFSANCVCCILLASWSKLGSLSGIPFPLVRRKRYQVYTFFWIQMVRFLVSTGILDRPSSSCRTDLTASIRRGSMNNDLIYRKSFFGTRVLCSWNLLCSEWTFHFAVASRSHDTRRWHFQIQDDLFFWIFAPLRRMYNSIALSECEQNFHIIFRPDLDPRISNVLLKC